MNDVKSLSHSKWRCKYHIVFAPKYRRQIIYGHAKRLISRHISPNEVLQALSNGRIIEDYPSDYPFPSCLVFGCTVQNRKLHIVCSIVNDDTLTIITAYEPDLNKWNETFTKRRDTR